MMKPVIKKTLKPISAILLVLFAVCTIIISDDAWIYGQTLVIYTSPVKYPLPTCPEPVLLGGTLRVEVEVGAGADGWTARLYSKYASSLLILENSSYSTAKGWTLFFQVPEIMRTGLYSLNLEYSDGRDDIDHVQPRCVWVLEEWPETFTIGHVTDTHLADGADVFATSFYEANLIRPDFIIFTGDIVDLETTTSAWMYFQAILDWLEVPGFFLPGNHDYGSGSIYYQRYAGLTNYSITLGDFLFLALDSDGGGYMTPEHLRWAEGVLQRHTDKVKIIGFHHPLFSAGDGGEITGSWENMGDLEDYMYFTWKENIEVAGELLRLVEEYDIRLILAGHVHRDVIYIYNERHHFVTTAPSGGSVPSGYYPGTRLIEVDSEGNIGYDEYTKAGMFDPPNSIPTGYVEWYYKTFNDGTGTAVSAIVENGLNRDLTDAVLEFVVSGEHPVEDYQFYPVQPEGVETVTTEAGHYFIATLDIPANSILNLTLAAEPDEAKPLIEIGFPMEYEPGADISVTIDVEDTGWGVRAVTATYSTDGGEAWTSVDLSFSPRVDKDNYVLEYTETHYDFTILDAPEGSELMVMVEAWDFAGNRETALGSFSVSAPAPPTYTLSVDSSPIGGVSFTLDGVGYTTPYSESLEEGSYTISMPEASTLEGENYTFTGWDDGVTVEERVVDLNEDTELSAGYEEVQVEEPEPEPGPDPGPDQEEEPEEPRRGIPMPIVPVLLGVLLGALAIFYLNRRN